MSALSNFWNKFIEPAIIFFRLESPIVIFIVISSIAAALIWGFKPSSMFFNDNPRPWAVTSNTSIATPVTWYQGAIFFGLASVLFI